MIDSWIFSGPYLDVVRDKQIKEVDLLIEDRFHRHRSAEVIASMPGMGVLLGAEFLAATGGDMTAFG